RVLFLCSLRILFLFFFSSRRRHTRFSRDWSSDVCSSDLLYVDAIAAASQRVADEVRQSVAAGNLPLVIGGDHALSIGSLAGSARSEERRVGKGRGCHGRPFGLR